MMDIAIPNNNEGEFISMAKKLGYDALCFLYNFDDYAHNTRKFEAIDKKIRVYTGILANSKDINKISSKFRDKNTFIAIKSPDNDREIIEGPKADLIFSIEENPRRDFIHQRASGLNHILCKLAKQNQVIIGFSLCSIINDKTKHVILGRMIQNLKVCRKFKVKTIIASFAQKPYEMRSAHDLVTLFNILGSKTEFLAERDIPQEN